MEHSKTTLGPRNLFAQSAHPIGDERLAKALALARENTAWALLHRLEVGRLEDLLRWIGTNAETDWLQRGQNTTVALALLRCMHESFNAGICPFVEQGRIRGGSKLVSTLGLSDRSIRTTSRQLEALLAQHGLDVEKLTLFTEHMRRLRRLFQPDTKTSKTAVKNPAICISENAPPGASPLA
jgi:hypothetical protein